MSAGSLVALGSRQTCRWRIMPLRMLAEAAALSSRWRLALCSSLKS